MFAGAVGLATTPNDLAAMAAALHGSAGAAGFWRDERLAIAAGSPGLLPEDVFDRQPLASTDLVFAAQARIDNRADVLTALSLPRQSWPSLADSEVVHLAYRRRALDCLQQLQGDFAFAAWHRETGRLDLAVNHLGLVPIFYAEARGGLVFGTQLAAVLAHSLTPRELDLAALGLLAAPKRIEDTTPYAKIRRLAAGHSLCWRQGAMSVRRWWHPDVTQRPPRCDIRDDIAEVQAIFDIAVGARLRASSGVAAALSGGLDSTLVTATAAGQQPHTRMTAYTAIPEPGLACAHRPGWDASDASYAAEVTARFDNIIPAAITPKGCSPLDILPAVHARSRMPTRNGGNILWLNAMADRMAGAGERVLLTGDKGNAVLSMARPSGGLRALARRVLGPLRALQSRPPRPGERFYVPAFRTAHTGALSTYASFSGREGFARFAMLGQRGWAVDPMAQWGIELRDPTGDRALIEHVLRLPDAVLHPDGGSRGLARRLGLGRVPDRVRLRRTRGEQVPELPAIVMAHRQAYRDVFERLAKLAPFRAIFDGTEVKAALARLNANDSATAHTLTRIADVGLFLLQEIA